MAKAKNTFFGVLFFVLGLFIFAWAADEKITITTYYPSPYGSYNELTSNVLRITNGSSSGRLRMDPNYFAAGDDAFIVEKTDDDASVSGGIIFGFSTSNEADTPITSSNWANIFEPAMTIRKNPYYDGQYVIGIGTTDPQVPLHIVGDRRYSDTDSTNTNPFHASMAIFDGGRSSTYAGYTGQFARHISLAFLDQAAARMGIYGQVASGSITSSRFYINTSRDEANAWNSPDFVITDAGQVGIGTNIPQKKLHIYNSGLLIDGTSGEESGNYTPRLIVDSGESYGHTLMDLRSTLASGVINHVLLVTGTGYVGINTDAPTANLQVNGSVRIVDGSEGDGKVLTSNSDGVGTWQSPPASMDCRTYGSATINATPALRCPPARPIYLGSIGRSNGLTCDDCGTCVYCTTCCAQ